MTELQPLTPAPLEQLIRACLAKDPDDRIQTAHDVVLHLKWLSASSTAVSLPTVPAARKRRAVYQFAAVAVLAALAAAFGAYRFAAATAPHPLVRFAVPPPPGLDYGRSVAVSPDGRAIAAVMLDDEGMSYLWLRGLDSAEPRALARTDGAAYPFWSADGRHVGFFAGRKLKKIEVSSGTVGTICDAGAGGGATWNARGDIVFAPHLEGSLWRVAATGGDPVEISKRANGETHHVWPVFLPDRTAVHLLGRRRSHPRRLPRDARQHREIAPVAVHEARRPVGHGLQRRIPFYIKQRSLLAQKLDVGKARLLGAPLRFDDGIDISGPGRAVLSVSGGVLAYRKGAPRLMSQLTWVDRSGRQLGTIGGPEPYGQIALSPDGRRLAVQRADGQSDQAIWIVDVARGSAAPFAAASYTGYPAWSPDGRSLAYSSARELPPNVYVRGLNGVEQAWTKLAEQVYVGGWTADGKSVVGSINRLDASRSDICVISPGEKIRELIRTPANEESPAVSPDGRWVAFESDESGKTEIYATSLEQPLERWQVSSGGGYLARWSRSGGELLFFAPPRAVMAAPIRAVGDVLEVGAPVKLFETRVNDFAVAADGRLLMATSIRPEAQPVQVVLNWRALAERKP